MKKTVIKKRFFVLGFILIFCLLSQHYSFTYEKEINNMAQTMAENIESSGKKTIAVADFTDLQGFVTELGRFLAEEFSIALAGSGKGFEVVDRTHLKILLIEHKITTTGIIDPQTARKLGQISGVEALITGTITPFGDNVRISAKILDVDTAKVISAISGNVAKTKAIEELLAKGIEGETPAKPYAPAPKMPVKSIQKVETAGYLVELIDSKLSGNTVICSLMITNTEKDRELFLRGTYYRGPSRIFDDFGNEYKAIMVSLADKSGEEGVKSLLVSGVPTKATIRFGGVSAEAKIITLLEIYCGYYWVRPIVFQFRNIPITR